MGHPMTISNDETGYISIGGLSKASGIAVETLRNWERRYGFPKPVRRESGHRRYPWDIVQRLRLIREVIELGYKPSYAVLANEEELEEIVHDARRATQAPPGPLFSSDHETELLRWLEFVERLDAVGLELGFSRAWSQYGAFHFITNCVVPFFREVGDRWEDGRYTVGQEHFASEIAQNFLAGQWRPLSRQARGGRVVLANLPGELHSLGLHMSAVFLALNHLQVIFLGPNTPLEDIVRTAEEPRVLAVVIGMAASSDLVTGLKHLRTLREALPQKSVIAVGGNDQLPEIEGVHQIESLAVFAAWAANLADR